MENRKVYQIGLFGAIWLCDYEIGIFCYRIRVRDGVIMLECNNNDNSTRIIKRTRKEKDFKEIDETTIENGIIKILSEDGSRWEGDWYNDKPFGFGCVYDGEGNRIYSGFMFNGKKVGYGEEYFADNHIVDYCGNFMNDLRHGWGTTYNRNGEKLYEGYWAFGKNSDFNDERIVIKDYCEEDDWRIHNLIKVLVIGKN